MAEITAALVKSLRETSGAGMLDCKKALVETNGNMEEAIDWLRKKGLASAAKKASRIAAEGLVSVYVEGNAGAVVEVNSETDFVAKNDIFQDYVENAAKAALAVKGDVEGLKAFTCPVTGKDMGTILTDMIAKIGENMNLRRAAYLSAANGVVCSYIHNAVRPNLGKIGVLVAVEGNADKAKMQELGKHIAFAFRSAEMRNYDKLLVARILITSNVISPKVAGVSICPFRLSQYMECAARALVSLSSSLVARTS